jgi:hypothetical protein
MTLVPPAPRCQWWRTSNSSWIQAVQRSPVPVECEPGVGEAGDRVVGFGVGEELGAGAVALFGCEHV